MTLQDFIRAIREYRALPGAKIETMPYREGKLTAVIVSGTPNEFPLITISPHLRWDMPEIKSFAENGVLTAFDACVHGDVLLRHVRSGNPGRRDKLYPHVVLTAPAPSVAHATPAPRLDTGRPVSSLVRPGTVLRGYFEKLDHQRRALEAYDKFAHCKDWSVVQKIKMYGAASRAFDPMAPERLALRVFREEIYEVLRKEWGVFRGYSPSSCWPPEQIFQTIKKEFSQLAWRGPVTLPNFISIGNRDDLLSKLVKMKALKPIDGYPVMAVSKFLHFYNPALFPIYDKEVIWDQVFKRFKNEFREFCSISGLCYGQIATAVFLRNYVCWGSSLIVAAHPNFMGTFLDWLNKRLGRELPQAEFDASSLYATAFEFTAIGAAMLEQI